MSDEFADNENYCKIRDHLTFHCVITKENIEALHIVSVISDTKDQKKFMWYYIVGQIMIIISSKDSCQKSSKDSLNTQEKHRTFSVAIKKEDKCGIIETYRIKSFDIMRLMERSL